jgi:hypothetical protein
LFGKVDYVLDLWKWNHADLGTDKGSDDERDEVNVQSVSPLHSTSSNVAVIESVPFGGEQHDYRIPRMP